MNVHIYKCLNPKYTRGQLYNVQIYNLQMYNEQMYNVQMYNVQMYNVQMYNVQNYNVQMFKCTNVQMYILAKQADFFNTQGSPLAELSFLVFIREIEIE